MIDAAGHLVYQAPDGQDCSVTEKIPHHNIITLADLLSRRSGKRPLCPLQTVARSMRLVVMELFSTRSWRLSDAQKLADEYPYTFHKPSSQGVEQLRPGDRIKLIFNFKTDDSEAPGAERMWVEIREISNEKFEGVLDNDPAYITDLKCGDPVTFAEKHVIQLTIDDPVPSKTDKYLPRCFVTHRVLYDGAPVGYLYREEPETDEDSGWRIMCICTF